MRKRAAVRRASRSTSLSSEPSRREDANQSANVVSSSIPTTSILQNNLVVSLHDKASEAKKSNEVHLKSETNTNFKHHKEVRRPHT